MNKVDIMIVVWAITKAIGIVAPNKYRLLRRGYSTRMWSS